MPKLISATEAKINLGAMMDWAVVEDDEVIILSRGHPKAVLVSYSMYQEVQKIQEVIRREQALAKLESLAATIQNRAEALSPSEAEEKADHFVREVVQEMVADGQISYQES